MTTKLARPEHVTKEFAANLATKRKANKVSARTLAGHLDISAQYLCDMELGRRAMAVEYADKIESFLK